jgi:hypothetical protein
MKKLLLTLLIVMGLGGGVVFAEEGGIYFKAGTFELTYPLSNLSAISLYDVWTGQGLIGGETQVAKWLRLNLNVGVITSMQADGCGFVSLDYDWAEMIPNLPPKFAKLGIFYGRDFKRSENRAGVKAALPIW